MKTTILVLLALIPVAATAGLYGFLESCANMVEMLLIPFTTDKTAGGALAIGGPFVVLFIALGAGVFILVPLFASIAGACLGGWALWRSGNQVPRRSAWRAIVLPAFLMIAFVWIASQYDSPMLVSRPKQKPKTPEAVLACLAGGNVALSLFVATMILCRITSKRVVPPILPAC